MKGSNKRKSFGKPVGMNGSNFDIGNGVVSSIKMSRNRLVYIIVPYGTKVFSKSVR